MTRSALVLGAGMVGTCTALHLAFRGYEVTLVDRREPGRETSYGNAGIIQREAVEPYAFPRGIPALLSAAFKRGADVNYHLGALPRLAAPLLRYWANSGPARYPAIARDYARLTEHATSEHARLIDAASAQDLVQRAGYRAIFRQTASLDAALTVAQRWAHAHLGHVLPAARGCGLMGPVRWWGGWTKTRVPLACSGCRGRRPTGLAHLLPQAHRRRAGSPRARPVPAPPGRPRFRRSG
jgi:glycine/D-amino acid oxidase-like deaminating enzyme